MVLSQSSAAISSARAGDSSWSVESASLRSSSGSLWNAALDDVVHERRPGLLYLVASHRAKRRQADARVLIDAQPSEFVAQPLGGTGRAHGDGFDAKLRRRAALRLAKSGAGRVAVEPRQNRQDGAGATELGFGQERPELLLVAGRVPLEMAEERRTELLDFDARRGVQHGLEMLAAELAEHRLEGASATRGLGTLVVPQCGPSQLLEQRSRAFAGRTHRVSAPCKRQHHAARRPLRRP